MTWSRMILTAVVGLAALGAGRAAHPHGAAPLVVTAPPVAAPAPAPVHGDCGPCTKTICVRETEKKAHTKTVYRCKTRTICLPYCTGRHCGGCDDGECGKPRQVRVLIKRFVKEEHCESKCVPKEVPVCHAPACTTPTCVAPTCAAPACPVTTPAGSPGQTTYLPPQAHLPPGGVVIPNAAKAPSPRGK